VSDEKSKQPLQPGRTALLADLVRVAPAATVSRVIARASGGTVTLFAFAAGQEISEHSAPFDALVQVLDGELALTIGGQPVAVAAGEVVVMPAQVPHALRALADTRMVLTMLRDQPAVP
jgi:quercetin dioxygenase-like cupin family protein